MSRSTQLVAIWLTASLIAGLLAMTFISAAKVNGEWIPAGNDSFYHARRILDAAESERGFYQFDETIHAPEGSWLTWPWAYDYFMAKGLQLATWVSGSDEAMKILAHVPPLWVLVNAGLLLLIAVALGLPVELTALVVLVFALSPMTQFLHGVGIIDHHYIELTFVLLALLTGLRCLQAPANSGRAITAGVALGLAPAFHNGLFALQLPLLATLVILWCRGQLPTDNKLGRLALALWLATLAALLPSEPFRDGQFSFYTLSWFHLYAATASASVILALRRWSFSRGRLALLGIWALLLAAMVAPQFVAGTGFLRGDIESLDLIVETQSPIGWLSAVDTWPLIAQRYSMLGVLVPLLLIAHLILLFRSQPSDRTLFSVTTIFGLALLLMQARLHYFGTFALLLGWLVIIDDFAKKHQWQRGAVFLPLALMTAIAYQPPVSKQLFFLHPPGMDQSYQTLVGLFPTLEQRCADNPGLLITDQDAGHYVRYHSDCSVMANNFLMTPQHEEKLRTVNDLMNSSADEFLQKAPAARYVMLRLGGLYAVRPDGQMAPTSVDYLRSRHPQLTRELLLSDQKHERFRVVEQLYVDDLRGIAYAGLFEIAPAGQSFR
ncbi:MAG: hypothetical protein ACR2P6_10105 [Gammaproteobacteria bacterium]